MDECIAIAGYRVSIFARELSLLNDTFATLMFNHERLSEPTLTFCLIFVGDLNCLNNITSSSVLDWIWILDWILK